MFIMDGEAYCDDCGEELRKEIDAEMAELKTPPKQYRKDEGQYPQGPFPLEEADYPMHCEKCGFFFGNALTTEGEAYVREAVQRGDGNPEVLAEWREEYSYLFQEADNA